MKKISLILILGMSSVILNGQYMSPPPPPAPKTDFGKENDQVYLNDIKAFPNEIMNWNVKFLNVIGTEELVELPDWIGNFKNLNYFGLSGGSRIKTFPRSFAKLQNLKEISIYSNSFEAIPDQILEIKGLEKFDFHCRYLKSFPENLGSLENLKSLNLSENRTFKDYTKNGKKIVLQSLVLPVSIKNLKKLEELVASQNHFVKLPNEIGQLDNLKNLYLGTNDLTSLPKTISELKKLTSISLSKNKFTVFPKELYNVENLKRIDYEDNIVNSIPPGIGNMKNLKYFFATRSIFSPQALAELYNLENLEKLDLSSCKITTFPEGIEKLKNLKSLFIFKNPISKAEVEKLRKALPRTKIVTETPPGL